MPSARHAFQSHSAGFSGFSRSNTVYFSFTVKDKHESIPILGLKATKRMLLFSCSSNSILITISSHISNLISFLFRVIWIRSIFRSFFFMDKLFHLFCVCWGNNVCLPFFLSFTQSSTMNDFIHSFNLSFFHSLIPSFYHPFDLSFS